MADSNALMATVKKRMFQAMKARETVEKEILRTAIGEVTSTGADPTDERVMTVLRKLVKSNNETLAACTDADQEAILRQEISILEEFLPQALNVDQILEELASVADSIRAATAAGPAMGIAMKTLKASGAEVGGQNVQAAVAKLRA